jgi:hypothetical protein
VEIGRQSPFFRRGCASQAEERSTERDDNAQPPSPFSAQTFAERRLAG